MPASASPIPAAKPRVVWVDTAKGLAIILVVLFHASIFTQDIGLAGPWGRISVVLDSFRMPLFFFTAGIFAASTIVRPLGELLRRRVALLVWVYVVWTLIFVVVFNLVPPVGRESPGWWGLLLFPVWPNESTWFVYGLALYFVAAWLLRRVPVPMQFVVAVVLALLFGTNLINTGNGAVDKIGMYFVFFLTAVHFGKHALRFVAALTGWQSAIAVVVYLVGGALVFRLGIFYVPGIRLALGFLAVGAGVAMSAQLARLPWMDWLRRLGSRTLPVYLLHFYPVLLVCVVLAPLAGPLRPFATLIPPSLALVAMLFALGFHRVTRGTPGLYDLPRRFRWAPPQAPVVEAAEQSSPRT